MNPELRTTPKLTRAEARKFGQVIYWDKNPCNNGHVGWWYTKRKRCWLCQKAANAKRNTREWASPQADARRAAEKLRDDLELERLLNKS